MDAINYDLAHPPTYIELPIPSDAANGIVSLGIKHYGDPSDPSVFYAKFFDLKDTEYM